jgi:hypothetical protein
VVGPHPETQDAPLQEPTRIGPTVHAVALTLAEQDAQQRARDLVTFADGINEIYPELARRSRLVANDLLELAQALTAERQARLAIQVDRDRLLKHHFPGAA